MQAELAPAGIGQLRLKKPTIRIELGGEQERDFQSLVLLTEILTDALFLGERVGHRCSTSVG